MISFSILWSMGCPKLNIDFFHFLEIIHSKKKGCAEKKRINYYPFGLQHKGYNNIVNGAEYNYQTYQGQEISKELGYNMLEFKYRHYDPAIGRFVTVDPLASKYEYNSTYAFQENKLGLGRELEGLELAPDSRYGVLQGFQKIFQAAGRNIDNFYVSVKASVTKVFAKGEIGNVKSSISVSESKTTTYSTQMEKIMTPDVNNQPSIPFSDLVKKDVKTASTATVSGKVKLVVAGVPGSVSYSSTENTDTGSTSNTAAASLGTNKASVNGSHTTTSEGSQNLDVNAQVKHTHKTNSTTSESLTLKLGFKWLYNK